MDNITFKSFRHSALLINAVLLFTLLFTFSANAQTCVPSGDQASYGENQWIGYVYSNISLSENPPQTAFVNSTYNGYTIEEENFDLNISNGAFTSENICDGQTRHFAVRFKMHKVLPAGYYTYTVGGDDGYRLSMDGGTSFPANVNAWYDHSYISSTETYYHEGGDIYFVFEFYNDDDIARATFSYAYASCNATAPTSISGNVFYTCAESTTLRAEGGIAGEGVIYQWGSGTSIGDNIINGETTSALIVSPTVNTNYWVRRVLQYPCSGYTEGITTLVTLSSGTAGDPATFGNGVWNVYGYTGSNVDLTGIIYKGYYTDVNVSYNSENSFDQWDQNPSNVITWLGCPIESNDGFTFVAKRAVFTCGQYQLNVLKWDDNIRIFVDGTQVFDYQGYSGGANPAPPIALGSFDLNENSQIEVRVAEFGGAANANFQINLISVQPADITGDETICSGEPLTLIATGGNTGSSGYYEWGTGNVGSNVILGETSNSITVTQTTDTTYWARIITNGGCNTAAVTHTVTISDNVWTGAINTDWSTAGNWSCSIVPTSDHDVIISAMPTNQPQISGSIFFARNLILNTDAQLTILTGTTLDVEDKITVLGNGDLTIQNNAALMQGATATQNTNVGSVTAIKNSNTIYHLDYTLWSSPTSGTQTLHDFSSETLATRYYEYGIVGAQEYYYTVPGSTTFEPAKGYLIRMPDNDATDGYFAGTTPMPYIGNFTGTPNNGTITIPASVAANRFTAVGNPYPSPISVEAFFAANEDVLNSSSGIYFWRKKNNAAASSYATLTLAAYTSNAGFAANPVAGGGAEQAVFFPAGNEASWLISQGQGFFIKTAPAVTSGTITFTNAMRRPAPVNGTQPFFRTGATTTSR